MIFVKFYAIISNKIKEEVFSSKCQKKFLLTSFHYSGPPTNELSAAEPPIFMHSDALPSILDVIQDSKYLTWNFKVFFYNLNSCRSNNQMLEFQIKIPS